MVYEGHRHRRTHTHTHTHTQTHTHTYTHTHTLPALVACLWAQVLSSDGSPPFRLSVGRERPVLTSIVESDPSTPYLTEWLASFAQSLMAPSPDSHTHTCRNVHIHTRDARQTFIDMNTDKILPWAPISMYPLPSLAGVESQAHWLVPL